ncbi:acyltransferase/acetyltransferase [Vibrio nigripulchritudo]|uniref:acyltransferase family protein n=1 Tax=Vibrio nigripulchritudo TaxID=28173 RepID=UPI00190D20AA|nr:acyltransferase [Vibrio nigripulchritudo]BCL73202.1 acyltransferase/acetyltransferase [Vibrio nigripulchritudo]BDU34566.1 acyltransferase/acetyltransferase [Vibrio nigripulchritudo]
MENRTNWVDHAKGIGIILVVYGHVARGLQNAGIEMSPTHFSLIDSVIYSFHMPLFFFLSGLFFYQSFEKRGSKRLIFSKIDTIFYPYILWSILQGGIEAVLSNYTNGNVTFSEVFALLWEPRAQFWFLYALFLVFVVSAFIYSFVARSLTAILFVGTALNYVFNTLLPDVQLLNYLYQNLVYFFFGIAFSVYSRESVFTRPQFLLISFVTFVALQAGYHGILGMNYSQRGLLSLILAISSIVFVVSLSMVLEKRSLRWLSYIGSASMGIYLMHILAGSGVRVVLTKVLGIQSFSVHLIVGCVVAIVAPLIALKITEMIKLRFVFSAPISKWFGSKEGEIKSQSA